jgi:RHH-type rel operon transcriptional repressor/antitoxin RelB
MTMATTSSSEAPTRTINVRVPASVYDQLEDLAKSTARTKSFVTVEALSSYLATQSWQVKEITAGIADADRGDFATNDQVNAVFAKYGA